MSKKMPLPLPKRPLPANPANQVQKPIFKGFSLYGFTISPIMILMLGGIGYWWWKKKKEMAR